MTTGTGRAVRESNPQRFDHERSTTMKRQPSDTLSTAFGAVVLVLAVLLMVSAYRV